MSEPFRPYERLVEITIFGKKFQVPEKNSVLRCFQYISPETVPYGRFCWNQDCQYCRIMCQLPDDDQPREMLSCKFIVMPGMAITDISQELKWCLRAKLPTASAVPRSRRAGVLDHLLVRGSCTFPACCVNTQGMGKSRMVTVVRHHS